MVFQGANSKQCGQCNTLEFILRVSCLRVYLDLGVVDESGKEGWWRTVTSWILATRDHTWSHIFLMTTRLRHRPNAEEEDASTLKLGPGTLLCSRVSQSQAFSCQSSTMPVVCSYLK